MATITVQTRNEYGNVRRYLQGPTGQAIRTLTGKATLSATEAQALIQLGHTITETP